MSDLQLSLLALGAAIIAGVVGFNWWQERRFMRESTRRFEGPADDALMDEFHIDPERVAALDQEPMAAAQEFEAEEIAEDATLEELERSAGKYRPASAAPTTPAQPESESGPGAAPEPLAEVEPAAPEPEAEPAPSSPAALSMPADVDERIELIGLARLSAPVDIGALVQTIRQIPRPDKPVRWFLQDKAGEWHHLTLDLASGDYLRLGCALQLADRSGPVTQGALLAFREQLAQLAATLGAELAWHGPADPLRYAAELDQFCIDVDVMVGFHILQGSSGSFAGTKLRGLAEAGGMVLQDDGAFHFRSGEGSTLFTVISHDQRPFNPETLRTVFYRGISFQLDVPRVERCIEAFNQMVQHARQLESALGGTLVDDNQRALGDADIEKIRLQLRMIQDKMMTYGILPGTPSAMRLFS